MQKKLRRWLSTAPDEAFFDLCWAVNALQTGREDEARRFIAYPLGAATPRFESKFSIYPWEIETLLGELLLTEKFTPRDGANRILNVGNFGGLATLVRILRKLENEESGIYLKRVSILDELHRIAQREFPWQSGYFNVVQFYRNAFVYGGSKCGEYFERLHGLTQNQFSLVGFATYMHFMRQPAYGGRLNLLSVGVSAETCDAAFRLFCAPLTTVRSKYTRDFEDVRARWGFIPSVAYRPSVFRQFPVVETSNSMFRSPLPELILQRVTSGIYYDLTGGGQALRNEASGRFELYCENLCRQLMPSLLVQPEKIYRVSGQEFRSPDVLLSRRGQLALAIECKASKLNLDAQYSEDPAFVAEDGYKQLAKGAYQVWRYFSHIRRGIVQAEIDAEAHGLVLTLDAWLLMSRGLRSEVLRMADAMAADDPGISEADKRPVVFSAVKDFEQTLMESDEAGFFESVRHAATESFTGWLLPGVHREIGGKIIEKEYPFHLRDVLPWVDDLEEMKSGRL
ncbi:hypothetical protein [Terricaulis silvestris]|uniref:hypothetical protein n=1 Tax=Terricaulis silvestris TaxID=2686094 RepID=UPI00131B7246|nr:hypothetical protein [Terricaulis silvestris]